jgi:hypothetical protein
MFVEIEEEEKWRRRDPKGGCLRFVGLDGNDDDPCVSIELSTRDEQEQQKRTQLVQ